MMYPTYDRLHVPVNFSLKVVLPYIPGITDMHFTHIKHLNVTLNSCCRFPFLSILTSPVVLVSPLTRKLCLPSKFHCSSQNRELRRSDPLEYPLQIHNISKNVRPASTENLIWCHESISVCLDRHPRGSGINCRFTSQCTLLPRCTHFLKKKAKMGHLMQKLMPEKSPVKIFSSEFIGNFFYRIVRTY